MIQVNAGDIQPRVTEGPVHGPEEYFNLQGGGSETTAHPEQNDCNDAGDQGSDGHGKEGKEDNGVPETEAGSSRNLRSSTKTKQPSKNKGDPDRPYKCPEPGCLKGINGFTRVDHLVRHMFDHYGPTYPYGCSVPQCNYTATRKDKITEHLKTNHKMNDGQAKTEAKTSAVAAKPRVLQIKADIKLRLASLPAVAGNQATDPNEQEVEGETHDSENVGEDAVQGPPGGEASPEDVNRRRYADLLIAAYDRVSSDDEEDRDGGVSKGSSKNKRPRDDADDDGAERKKMKMS